jgi:hypothetical protein
VRLSVEKIFPRDTKARLQLSGVGVAVRLVRFEREEAEGGADGGRARQFSRWLDVGDCGR